MIIPSYPKAKVKALLAFFSPHGDAEELMGFYLCLSFVLSIFGTLLSWFIFKLDLYIVFPLLLVGILIVLYFMLVILIDTKARKVEQSLPNALQLTAANLHAGMTLDKALLLSSRPEFGSLKDELDLVGKKISLGENFSSALQNTAARIRSKKLARAVELINIGLSSGGELAKLLESTAANLREQFLVDKKIKASISMYIIFIFAAAGIISPILFGLSTFLVDIIKTTFAQVEIPTSVATLPIAFSALPLSSEFLQNFIVVFVITNSFMASSLLGLIEKGKAREGFRYFIPMVLLGVPLFYLSHYLIKQLLGGLFNF